MHESSMPGPTELPLERNSEAPFKLYLKALPSSKYASFYMEILQHNRLIHCNCTLFLD